MKDEDKEILKSIQSIAYGLLEYSKGHKCFDWGQSLYDIHKYLEARLNSGDTQKANIKQPIDISEDLQGVFTHCHIDRVILSAKDEK